MLEAEPALRWTTQADAARRLGLSRSTVHRLVRDKILSEVKVRGKYFVTIHSIESYEQWTYANPGRRVRSA